MSSAEHPDRVALQLRERIWRLIADLPDGHPARVEGEREIARLDTIAYVGEVRGEHAEPELPPMRSLGHNRRHST